MSSLVALQSSFLGLPQRAGSTLSYLNFQKKS